MNTNEKSSFEFLKSCWEQSSTEEREQFLSWANLIERDAVKKQLEMIATIEEIDEMLANRLENLNKRFSTEFEKEYQFVSGHFSDLKKMINELILGLT